MLNVKIFALLLTLGGTLYAAKQAAYYQEDPQESYVAEKSVDNIQIKDHCHAHRTPHGCFKRHSCYWDYYQNRCLYR